MNKPASETMTPLHMMQMARLLKDGAYVQRSMAQVLLSELPRSQRGHFAISDEEWEKMDEGEAAWLLLDIATNVPHGWTEKEKQRVKVLIARLEEHTIPDK